MREHTGDLFSLDPVDGLVADAIVIPTNTEVAYTFGSPENPPRPLGTMGAGVARIARERYPWIQLWLGERQVQYGSPHVYAHKCYAEDRYVVALPTKTDWRRESSIALIVTMLYELVTIANAVEWHAIHLPRLGCGRGGLEWTSVKRAMEQMLDDRFCVIDLKGD